MKFYLITFFFVLVCTSQMFGQEVQDEIDNINLQTQESLEKVINKSIDFPEDIEFRNSVSQLNLSTYRLYEKLQAQENLAENDLWMESLKNAQETMEFIASTPISEASTEAVKYLIRDFEIKINASPNGLFSSVISEVQVNVKVEHNGTYLEGLEIFGNYVWEFNRQRPRFAAHNLTNNAVLVLSPGIYRFYVEHEGETVSKDFEIGLFQTSSEEVTIKL